LFSFIDSIRHADPYRLYAEYEMSFGNYEQARKILFRGAQVVSQSSDGGLGNRRGLAELFHTWALCEWHLGNPERAEVLFDNALRLTETGEKGSGLRAFILYSIARLEHHRDKFHLAQHCVGLCLKEGFMPGGNLKVWQLWADIAREMDNDHLEQECQEQVEKATREIDDDSKELSRLLSGNAGDNVLMRRDPWQCKLFGMTGNGSNERSENFYTFSKFPWFRQSMMYQE
jgi:tetratricopeptide (TPR) repeat protein